MSHNDLKTHITITNVEQAGEHARGIYTHKTSYTRVRTIKAREKITSDTRRDHHLMLTAPILSGRKHARDRNATARDPDRESALNNNKCAHATKRHRSARDARCCGLRNDRGRNNNGLRERASDHSECCVKTVRLSGGCACVYSTHVGSVTLVDLSVDELIDSPDC